MAPKMSGRKTDDHMASVELCQWALRFAEAVLKEGGCFVTKIFEGSGTAQYRGELEQRFGRVRTAKPLASREESREVYLVCCRYMAREAYLAQGGASAA